MTARATVVAIGALLMAPSAVAAELPLGSRSLDERRESAVVAPGLRWTQVVREGGPWRVNVLAIDREALAGRLGGVLSNERVSGLERPSTMSRRTGAVAGVNGGFFAVDGDPVGALAVDGRLVSEPVNRRSALIVPADRGARPRIAPLSFTGSVTAGAGERLIDGVDRRRGSIPACGGRGGDQPTQRPDSALTCTDPSELVLLDSSYGALRPSTGVEALVRGGVVERIGRPRSRAVPRDALVLSGSGDAAAFLRSSLEVGGPAQIELGLGAGQTLVTGGGPRLLARGRVAVAAGSEGFAPLSAPGFVASRHPRTLAGVKSDGTVLLVTVDGRQPGWSAGVTLPEAARMMRALGARNALNLDGGGSTGMVVLGELVSRPSDPSGERAVSDGIFVLP